MCKIVAHLFLVLISCFAFTFECDAYTIFITENGKTIESDVAPRAKQSIVEMDGIYKITYTFDSLIVVKDDVFPNKSYFMLPDFAISEAVGRAASLVGLKRYTFDNQSLSEISNIQVEYYDYKWDYSPAREPQLNNSDVLLTETNIEPITVSDNFFPEIVVEQAEQSIYRGHTIQNISICPIQYNSKTGMVRINRKISFYLSELEIDSKSVLTGDISDDDFTLFSVAQNLSDPNLYYDKFTSDNKETIDASKHYLIITIPSYLSEVNKFAEWKRTMGYTVEIASQDVWTTDGVKDAIEYSYRYNKNLYYVLLVGDINNIPACDSRESHISLGSKFKTDVPYSCLDGEQDFYPDLLIGRIPASTSSEAANVFEKIISYEKDPSFNNNITKAICSTYFQDDDRNGVEDRGFTYTTERIFNYIALKYDEVSRIYYANSSVIPTRWSARYGNGMEVPTYLMKPNFKWSGNKTDIIDAFNEGCNLFYHRDHGGYTGWGEPSIYTSDLVKLSNKAYPILLSIDCNVGNFENSRNFGRTILNKKLAGAASVIASVQPSYTNRNDALITGMVNAVWPSPGITHNSNEVYNRTTEQLPSVTCLGEMLVQAMTRVDECFSFMDSNGKFHLSSVDKVQKDLYHCLGDPSLSLFWNASVSLKGKATFKYTDGGILVSNLPYRSFISSYNKTTGETRRVNGYGALIPCNNNEDVSIAVSRPGYKPFFITPVGGMVGERPESSVIQSVVRNGSSFTIKLSDNYDFIRTEGAIITVSDVRGNVGWSTSVVEGNYIYNFNFTPVSHGVLYIVVSVVLDGKVLDHKKILVRS